jgi:protein dithiol oxidoreductase (disulfide-forming)
LNLGPARRSEGTMNNLSIVSRVRRALAAGVLLLAAGTAPAAVELQQGVNYKLLTPAQPTSVAPGKVEVVEVFWYACGHCYLLEPKLEAWNRSGRPASAELVRLPATWNNVLKTHARLFYTMELLGKQNLNPEIWREINLKNNRLDTPESIEKFFTSRGVSKADFQKAFSGFAIDSKIMKAEDLNRRYKITGTPAVVVNGKYITDVSMAGSEDKLFEVINALVAKEKAAR